MIHGLGFIDEDDPDEFVTFGLLGSYADGMVGGVADIMPMCRDGLTEMGIGTGLAFMFLCEKGLCRNVLLTLSLWEMRKKENETCIVFVADHVIK